MLWWLWVALTTQVAGVEQPGWQPNPELVKKLSERRPNVIYDESKVPAYTLPEPTYLP